MNEKILNQLIALLKIESIAEKPEKLQEALDFVLNIVDDKYTVERFESDGKPSALLYYGQKRPDTFKVLLNAHLDVVPGKHEQFMPRITENKLYARGAYDMKSAGLLLTHVFNEMADKVHYPLGLQLVTDEELGGKNGSLLQINNGVDTEFVIAGEKTDFDINTESKGICMATILASGEPAHSAYQWQGESATDTLLRALFRLRNAFPYLVDEQWVTSLNIATLDTTNTSYNSVPDTATAKLDFRFIPNDPLFTLPKNKIVEKLVKITGEKVAIDIFELESSHYADHNHHYIQQLAQAINQTPGYEPQYIKKHGGSDIRYYSDQGIPAVTFGIKGYGPHTSSEYVDLDGLSDYQNIVKSFLSNLE